MKLIIGLGNPGATYAHTRHNIGWDAVATLATDLQASFAEKARFHANIAEAHFGDEKIILVHPLTFMNRSGEAVQALIQFYKVDLQDVLIVQDEMDYPLGRLSLCAEAGPAGHNGVSSIQETLGTTTISRLRLGIGRPEGPIAKEDFVLRPFAPEEQEAVATTLVEARQAVKDWCQEGIEGAMNSWN